MSDVWWQLARWGPLAVWGLLVGWVCWIVIYVKRNSRGVRMCETCVRRARR